MTPQVFLHVAVRERFASVGGALVFLAPEFGLEKAAGNGKSAWLRHDVWQQDRRIIPQDAWTAYSIFAQESVSLASWREPQRRNRRWLSLWFQRPAMRTEPPQRLLIHGHPVEAPATVWAMPVIAE